MHRLLLHLFSLQTQISRQPKPNKVLLQTSHSFHHPSHVLILTKLFSLPTTNLIRAQKNPLLSKPITLHLSKPIVPLLSNPTPPSQKKFYTTHNNLPIPTTRSFSTPFHLTFSVFHLLNQPTPTLQLNNLQLLLLRKKTTKTKQFDCIICLIEHDLFVCLITIFKYIE